MKNLQVQVRSRDVATVVRLANEHGAFSPSSHEVRVDGRGGWSMVVLNLPNHGVGPFLGAVENAVEEAEFSVPTTETLPIATPVADVRDQVKDVSRHSTLEVVYETLQSLGSWQGMLAYAAVSGLVAAYAVMFGIPFLLTAAMLIAPVGAPAMVCVVAISVGDLWMLRRGALRFAVALITLTGAAALLGLAYGLQESTGLMEMLTNLSHWSALLGVAGGAAGALALVQAERDSLVTATATGFLVAVSLSPPSAVLGLAVAIGRWDYAALMAFLVSLTLAGILVGGWIALSARGIGPREVSAEHGHPRTRRLLAAAALIALLALIGWQVTRGPSYRKADLRRNAARIAREAVTAVPGYRPLLIDTRFTTGDADWHEGEGLVLNVTVAATDSARSATSDSAGAALRAAIHDRVAASLEGVRPFVDVVVVPAGTSD